MKRAAFTMIELLLVIIVLGILASLALPRMDRDTRQHAADNLLSAIRYTQHLALMDNVVDSKDDNWQRAFWRIGFENCENGNGLFYYIGSDNFNKEGNINHAQEAAVDPTNGKKMMGANDESCDTGPNNSASPNIFLTHNYGIVDKDDIVFTGSCSNAKYIGFDHQGRPHQVFTASNTPNYSSILKSDCNITVNFDNTDIAPFSIIITKETGYTYIEGQKSS